MNLFQRTKYFNVSPLVRPGIVALMHALRFLKMEALDVDPTQFPAVFERDAEEKNI